MNRKKPFESLKDESGFVLVMGMILTSIIAAIGLAALNSSTTEINITKNQKTANQLLYASEAGVDRLNNLIWSESAFSSESSVDFASIDDLAYLSGPFPYPLISTMQVGPSVYNDTSITKFDKTDSSKRTITVESRGWTDLNGNGIFDAGEPSKTIETEVTFDYASMGFPFALLTQNAECILCHTHINGDVVSLNTMTARNEAYSVITGTIYSIGSTNLNSAGVNVAKDYNGTSVNVITDYTDARFPVDADGNAQFPKIENLAYYKSLAAAYNNGVGSTIAGGSKFGVLTGFTYASKVALPSVSNEFNGHMILDGTTSCVNIDGPFVVDGDLVIKGCIEGQGVMYTGGNVYIAGSVYYGNTSTDKLGLAAGGNIVFGDYRSESTGGMEFIKQQTATFNTIVAAIVIDPMNPKPKRYYKWPDGKIYSDKDGNNQITPQPIDKVVGFVPTNSWISDVDFATNLLDNINGVTRIDGLLYTGNAIFGINKTGQQKTVINGSLVGADIGILVAGPDGKNNIYDPDIVGLSINYDSRMQDFITVARTPMKRVASWKEVPATAW